MKFLIRGGQKLSGEINVSGAKNSVLKGMAASVLSAKPVILDNVPLIEDVFRMRELLEHLGAEVAIPAGRQGEGGPLRPPAPTRNRGERSEASRTLRINPSSIKKTELKNEIAERLRASIVLAGPVLARLGKVSFPHPGGCVIGKRPIDVFLAGWQAMGAKVRESQAGFLVSARKLKGKDFTFRLVSVTGTETLMLTAALAYGKTVLRNAAMEPEIPHLAEFLNDSGVKISGAGTPTIEIIGSNGRLLHPKSPFQVLSDRIEAGSFLILGAALGRKLKVVNCIPEHLTALIAALQEAGVGLEIGQDWISVSQPRKLKAVDVRTHEYPGFPTDLQAPWAVLMTQAQGDSLIFETIFEGRFSYIEELKRMGAKILTLDEHRILVKGPAHLRGREIESPDLRAGLAFVIAALLAKGESVINNIYQIDRGYEKIDERLKNLGADISRLS